MFSIIVLCGFRERCRTQYTLINLQKWQIYLDESEGIVGTFLLNLSKNYVCVNHDLLITKLLAYGVGENSLKLIQNHLPKRQQSVEVGSSFNEWLEIFLGIPQGSIQGPIIFNIFINDLLYFIRETDICSFADDATLYVCGRNLDSFSNKVQVIKYYK